jgi:DNA-binding MarR family transcriptional regulator
MPPTSATRERLLTTVAQLVRTGRHVGVRSAAQLYGDLPSFGWALMHPLEQDDALRCSDIAVRAGIDVSVASRQLAVLERSGFVERRPDPRDGRASLLRLTPQGTDALAAARAVRADWALSALADWDEGDAARLNDLLERLVSDVTAVMPPPSGRPLVVADG